jgi:uncharacterized FAD-dependent dehydrogenase
MYRIHEIKLGLKEDKNTIPEKIKRKLEVKAEITDYKIVKESIDARDKGNIKYIYTVDFSTDVEINGLAKAPNLSYHYPEKGQEQLKNRPVIAGFGPCGMFAALLLSEMGYAPIVLERGKPIEDRVQDVQRFWNDGILDEESNVQFGEGGAGTFSDGKLTTGIKDTRTRKVLEELVIAGANENILYKQKPHVGTDVLRRVVKNIREKIIKNGGEILFNTRLDSVIINENKLFAVKVCDNNGAREIQTENLILAIGHSARDTIRALNSDGLLMSQKPFSIGIRIEHTQELINNSQYGKNANKKLPPAEYKVSHRCEDGRGVYTFCMCPGGEVISASSQAGGVVTNGMSNNARDGKYANSAVLVDVKTTDFESEDPLAGLLFQEKYEKLAYMNAGEKYHPPQTTWKDFSTGEKTALPVINSLPAFAVENIKEAMPYFARKLQNFDDPEAKIFAVESRSSSPVRINRDENFESNIEGIFPGGEGAGYAGGIMSAAVDGIKLAEIIIIRESKNHKNNI